jgi:hypothetical protein
MFCSEKVMPDAPTNSKSIWKFDPRSIPGCQTWLDATDSNTITYSSGSNVSLWKDKAPYGNYARRLQGTPTCVSNALNGLPAMYLDGSNATSAAFTGTCPPNVTNQLTVFAVFTVESGVQDAGRLFTLMYPDYQNPNAVVPLAYNTASNTLRVERNSVGYNATSNALTFGTPTLAACTVNGATTTVHINGTQALNTSTVASNLAYTYYTIGCFGQSRGVNDSGVSPWNGYLWKGYLGEIILYSNALSTTQRQQVEGYLAWKWGFQTSTNSPTSIGGLALWLDANDATTLTLSGSNVSQWSDKSGTSNHAVQATASNRPTYATDSGYPAVAFSGSAQYLFGTNPLLTSTSMSMFIVHRTTNTSATQYVFFDYKVINSNYVQFLNVSGSYTGNITYATSPVTDKAFTYSSTSNRTMTSFVDSPTNTTNNFYANGARVTTTLTSGGVSNVATDAVGYGIGVFRQTLTTAYGTFYFQGYIYEIIVYLTELTSSQRQQVERYLSKKWGVSLTSSLPNSHPFYSITPGLRTFRPIDIDGCALWLDAADATTLTLSSSNVTQWNDKSGNAYHAVGYNNTATYNATGLNSKPALTFSSTKSMVAPVPAGTFPSAVSTFVVYQFSGVANGGSVYTIINRTIASSSNLAAPFSMYEVAGTDYRYTGNGGTGAGRQQTYGSSTGTLYTTTTPTIYYFNITSNAPTTWNESVNGVTATYSMSNSTYGGSAYGDTASNVCIGGRLDTGVFMNGFISEVIMYNTTLTTAQRQQVETYLIRKWGIPMPTIGVSSTTPSLTNCNLWLDGADILGTGAAAPTTITTWADKSGTGNTVTANLLTAGQAIASSPMGPFMNGACYFSITGGLVNSIVNVPFVIFIVETPAAANGTYFFFGNDSVPNPATNNTLHIGYRNSGQFTFAFYGNDIEVVQSFPNGVTRVWAFYMPSSGNRTVRLNGSIVGTGNTTKLGNFNAPVIGRIFGNYNDVYTGTISEILVYNTDIGLSAVQTIESYLMAKWQPGTLVPKFTIPADVALPFSPLQITGCCLWLDGNDPAGTGTQPSAGALATWTDKSGSSNHMTAAGTTPTFSNVPPGAVTFGGAGYYSNATPVFSNFYTAFFVYKQTGGGPLYTTGASSGSNGLFPNESGTTYFTRGDSTWYTTSSPFASNVVNLAVASFSSNAVGSNQSLFYNGSNVVTTTQSNTITYTNFLLGSRQSGGTSYFTGSMYEVIAYNGTLSTDLRQRVEGYLAQKWKF